MPRDELALIEVVEVCERIARVARRLGPDPDPDLHGALLWPLANLGEACARVSSDLRAARPEVGWALATAFRNRIGHGYETVRFDVAWQVATVEVPAFRERIEALVATEFPLVAAALRERGVDL